MLPRPEPSGAIPAVYVMRIRPNMSVCPSSTAATARHGPAPRRAPAARGPCAENASRSRWRVSAKGTLSTTLIASNTPSPTVKP